MNPIPEVRWAEASPAGMTTRIEATVRAGRTDDLLTDAEFLVWAEPDVVAPLLSAASGGDARLSAWVYWRSLREHRAAGGDHRRW
ncbi:MAG TPA: hypothetical protein VGL02_21445, partial [Streptomyces sp.]